VSASRGQLLGSCLLWVAAARDGTTLFWSHDRCVGEDVGGLCRVLGFAGVLLGVLAPMRVILG
jgi:hypothetical protein